MVPTSFLMEKNSKMKIVIANGSDEGPLTYETENIINNETLLEANALIRTISVVDIVKNALQLSNSVYRESLGKTLSNCEEALVAPETDED